MVISLAILIATAIGLMKCIEAEGFVERALCLLFGLFVALVPIVIAGGVFGADYDKCTVERTKSNEIIALKDNMAVEGQFYLFGGHINGDLYYFYAQKTDIGYTTKKVKASNCYINYTSDTPKIELYEAKGFKKWTTWIYGIPTYYHYSIFVPEGSLTTDFEINLE